MAEIMVECPYCGTYYHDARCPSCGAPCSRVVSYAPTVGYNIMQGFDDCQERTIRENDLLMAQDTMFTRELAKYVIARCNRSGNKISTPKLQQMMYYVAGVYAGEYGVPLIKARFAVSEYGAYLKSLRYAFQDFELVTTEYPKLYVSSDELSLINYMIDIKAPETTWELVHEVVRTEPCAIHRFHFHTHPLVMFNSLATYFKTSPELRAYHDLLRATTDDSK